MKKNNIIKAAATLCIMHCALCITSCSQEEEASDNIPMTLTATVGQPTRSTVENSWDGTEEIAVSTTQVGEDAATVKKYTASSAGKLSVSTGVEPFYFKYSTETKSVSAWYPYSDEKPTTWTVQTDQSGDGYAKSDYLYASDEVTSNATITFEHQTAKLTLNLTNKTTATITAVEVYDGITPHKGNTTNKTTVYNALISPQQLSAGTTLFTITTADNIYMYTLDAAKEFNKAKEYVYNITISYYGIEITSCTINDWNGETKEEGVTMNPLLTDEEIINALYSDYTTVNVADVSGEVQDKSIITGTSTTGITIAAGASVVFNGISSTSTIKCSGSATINLIGTNSIDNGIQAGESGTTLTIDGNGSLTINQSGNTIDNSAGIGSTKNGTCGDIVINNGTITVNGGEYGAAIGSGHFGTCGDITINGGTITATGGSSAAAIGSGNNNSKCGKITITGGTIVAQGGQIEIPNKWNATDSGAGIGSGDYYVSCGDIEITGGNIIATGCIRSAGIGSGSRNSTCGNITISAGTITATGGQYGAGIGSGDPVGSSNSSTCGNITIKSTVTKVIATKGSDAPNSIGAGNDGTCGTVTIEDETKVTQN